MFNSFFQTRLLQIAEEDSIAEASHIPIEEFIQKLESQGAYSSNAQPTIIPEQPMTKWLPVQAQKVFQKLCNKNDLIWIGHKIQTNYQRIL